ncbi:MAG: PH domain-containing protein [Coriobacteriia bacterium]|nr:PH domain-containing protein [Coriobacteriia bacterium]
MSDASATWFRSKIDWWIGLILVVLPFIELGGLAAALLAGDREAATAMAMGSGLVAAIYGLLLIPIRYGITEDRLIIRFGVVRRSIPLSDIREVHPTRNPLASPALSLDRLAIRVDEGFIGMSLVSPSEREEFLSLLASSAGLSREGNRLVRIRDSMPSA